MPAPLKPDARCPKCGVPIRAVVWTTNPAGVVPEGSAKFYHDKDPEASPRCRRPLPCTLQLSKDLERDLRRELHQ